MGAGDKNHLHLGRGAGRGMEVEKQAGAESAAEMAKQAMETASKKERRPEKKSADQQGMKKVRLEGKEYYIVSLEEIEKYKKGQEKYKGDRDHPFIVYLKAGFLKDLRSLRQQEAFKKGTMLVMGGVVTCTVIVGGIFLLKTLFP
jgi:hypothetical protein